MVSRRDDSVCNFLEGSRYRYIITMGGKMHAMSSEFGLTADCFFAVKLHYLLLGVVVLMGEIHGFAWTVCIF